MVIWILCPQARVWVTDFVGQVYVDFMLCIIALMWCGCECCPRQWLGIYGALDGEGGGGPLVASRI